MLATYRFSVTWEVEFSGRELAVWTAPAKLRCGDLILLYEAGREGGRKAFVAIGRAVTDAVWAYEGDDAYWAWIEWRAVRRPLGLDRAKKAGRFSVIGSHGSIDGAVFTKVARQLTAGDAAASRALRRWKAGEGFPSTDKVPIRDLALASLQASENEQSLYKPIKEHLQAQGWVDLSPEIRAVIRSLRGPLAFDPTGDYGLRPDILLTRPRAKRVMVIEVKRAAARTQGYRNPVDQVLDYSKAVSAALRRDGLRGWTIEPLLVAEQFSALVLDDAKLARVPRGIGPVECKEWTGRRLGRPTI